jgi:hypothetical protein
MEIMAAARARNPDRLLRAGLRAPDRLMLVRERGLIMVQNCTGSGFIASMPIGSSEGVMALAGKLEALQKARAAYAAAAKMLLIGGS